MKSNLAPNTSIFPWSLPHECLLRSLLFTQYNPECSLVGMLGLVMSISLEQTDTAALKIGRKNL